MTVSVTSICNSGLSKLGQKTIASIDENSVAAKLCKEQYEKLRDEVLRDHPWNFAIKRQLLSQGTAPVFGYTYAYTLPSDYLRAVGVYSTTDEDDKIEPYQEESGFLLADEATMYLKYIYRCSDTTKYDVTFREALALRLAAEFAIPLTQSTEKAAFFEEKYRAYLGRCRSLDSHVGTPPHVFTDLVIKKRA